MLVAIGVIVPLFLVSFLVYRLSGSHRESVTFEVNSLDRQTGLDHPDMSRPQLRSIPSSVNFELWSEKRIAAYKETLSEHFDSPVALLEIAKIHLEVPVFNGTDEAILNRGVGRIIGTGRPGGKGNIGIAGHRDGFFRALKDVAIGDSVDLLTTEGQRRYRVDNITIVTPYNVEILRDRNVPTLTLVTCYPFYFHGDAPQRYILQCTLNTERHTLASREQITAAGTAQN